MINSHLIQAIVVLRQSKHLLTSWAILLHLLGEVFVRGLITIDTGMSLKYQYHLMEHRICFVTLQKRFERHGPYEMFQELKLIFQANTWVERYEVSNKFYS